MKTFLIPVWAAAVLLAGEAKANPLAERLAQAPEPSSLVMLGLGVGAVLVGLRGRRRNSAG